MEQAKEFFEKGYTERLTKTETGTAETGRFRGKLHPGEYTPLWDKAVYSESEGVSEACGQTKCRERKDDGGGSDDGNTSGTIVQPAKRHFGFFNFLRR